MRKVGNMRVPESGHKSKEQLQFERDQREGMLRYIEQMEEQYTKAKAGMTELENDEYEYPDEKKTRNAEGEPLIYGVMARREDEPDDGNWYAIGYTYIRERAIQSYVFVTTMNSVVSPRYTVKLIGIRETDWKAGYGASWHEKKGEEGTEPTSEIPISENEEKQEMSVCETEGVEEDERLRREIILDERAEEAKIANEIAELKEETRKDKETNENDNTRLACGIREENGEEGARTRKDATNTNELSINDTRDETTI